MSINRKLVDIFTTMDRMYFLPSVVRQTEYFLVELFDNGIEMIQQCNVLDYEHGFLFETFKDMDLK